jgi:hypothetical protein
MVIGGVAVNVVAVQEVAIIIPWVFPSGHVAKHLCKLVAEYWAVLQGQESKAVQEPFSQLLSQLGLLVVRYIDKGNARTSKPTITTVCTL